MKKVKKVLNFIKKIITVLMVAILIVLTLFAVVQKTSDNRKSILGIKIFTVISGSMIPVYEIGDIVIVKDVLVQDLKVGDDIVYKGEKGSYRNKTITHRIVSLVENNGEYIIVTKGVNNTGQDPAINETQIYGKVIGQISIVSFILKIITNIYTWILIPVIILVKKNIKKIQEMGNE